MGVLTRPTAFLNAYVPPAGITYQNRLSERAVNFGAGTGSGDFTSSTFTTAAGTLLVAVVTIDDQNVALPDAQIPTPTTSGTTWSKVVDASYLNFTANTAGVFIYVADSPGAGTGRTFAMSGTGAEWDARVNAIDVLILEFTGAANAAAHLTALPVANDVFSASGVGRDLEALSVTANSTPRANSMMLTAFAGDAETTAGGTPGTGFTELVDRDSPNSPFLRTYIQIREGSSTSTEVGWVGGDLNSSDTAVIYDYVVSYLEIMAATTTRASDDFNRADGGLGANWTDVVGTGLSIVSNAVNSTAATNIAKWNAATFAGDQWAQVSVTLGGIDSEGGVALRCGTDTGYYATWSTETSGTYFIQRRNSGSTTSLASLTGQGTTGTRVVRLEMVGSQLILYIDGVEKLTTTDTTYTTGPAGIAMWRTGTTAIIDGFSAGDWG